jgi:hypothetical protein
MPSTRVDEFHRQYGALQSEQQELMEKLRAKRIDKAANDYAPNKEESDDMTNARARARQYARELDAGQPNISSIHESSARRRSSVPDSSQSARSARLSSEDPGRDRRDDQNTRRSSAPNVDTPPRRNRWRDDDGGPSSPHRVSGMAPNYREQDRLARMRDEQPPTNRHYDGGMERTIARAQTPPRRERYERRREDDFDYPTSASHLSERESDRRSREIHRDHDEYARERTYREDHPPHRQRSPPHARDARRSSLPDTTNRLSDQQSSSVIAPATLAGVGPTSHYSPPTSFARPSHSKWTNSDGVFITAEMEDARNALKAEKQRRYKMELEQQMAEKQARDAKEKAEKEAENQRETDEMHLLPETGKGRKGGTHGREPSIQQQTYHPSTDDDQPIAHRDDHRNSSHPRERQVDYDDELDRSNRHGRRDRDRVRSVSRERNDRNSEQHSSRRRSSSRDRDLTVRRGDDERDLGRRAGRADMSTHRIRRADDHTPSERRIPDDRTDDGSVDPRRIRSPVIDPAHADHLRSNLVEDPSAEAKVDQHTLEVQRRLDHDLTHQTAAQRRIAEAKRQREERAAALEDERIRREQADLAERAEYERQMERAERERGQRPSIPLPNTFPAGGLHSHSPIALHSDRQLQSRHSARDDRSVDNSRHASSMYDDEVHGQPRQSSARRDQQWVDEDQEGGISARPHSGTANRRRAQLTQSTIGLIQLEADARRRVEQTNSALNQHHIHSGQGQIEEPDMEYVPPYSHRNNAHRGPDVPPLRYSSGQFGPYSPTRAPSYNDSIGRTAPLSPSTHSFSQPARGVPPPPSTNHSRPYNPMERSLHGSSDFQPMSASMRISPSYSNYKERQYSLSPLRESLPTGEVELNGSDDMNLQRPSVGIIKDRSVFVFPDGRMTNTLRPDTAGGKSNSHTATLDVSVGGGIESLRRASGASVLSGLESPSAFKNVRASTILTDSFQPTTDQINHAPLQRRHGGGQEQAAGSAISIPEEEGNNPSRLMSPRSSRSAEEPASLHPPIMYTPISQSSVQGQTGRPITPGSMHAIHSPSASGMHIHSGMARMLVPPSPRIHMPDGEFRLAGSVQFDPAPSSIANTPRLHYA